MARADLSEELVAYWPFDGRMADVVSDHHLAPRGKPTFVEGKFGMALNLNGKDQYLETVTGDNNAFLPGDLGLTVSGWFQPSARASGGAIISKGNADTSLEALRRTTVRNLGDLSWDVKMTREVVQYGANRPNFLARETIGLPAAGGFTHVAVTVDHERTIRFYLDGVFLSEQIQVVNPITFTIPELGDQKLEFFDLYLGPSNLRIGRSHHFESFYAGLVDEIAIWQRPLSSGEIKQLAADPPGALFEDADSDQLYDFWERRHGLDPTVDDRLSDADEDGLTALDEWQAGTSPRDNDSDRDGLSDGVETGTGVWIDASNSGTRPELPDSDEDGLPDGQEDPGQAFVPGRQAGSDPNVADSDGDGFTDEEEFSAGSNPSDRASTPPMIDGLMAFWPFEGNLQDVWNAYHGRALDDRRLTYAQDGPFGTSVEFGGINEAYNVDDGIEIDSGDGDFDFFGSSFSVAAWLRADPRATEPDDDRAWSEGSTIVANGGEQPWTVFAFPTPPPGSAAVAASLSLNPAIATAERVEIIGVANPPLTPILGPTVDAFRGDLFRGGYRHVVATYDRKTGGQQVYLDGRKLPFLSGTGQRVGRAGQSRAGYGNGLRIGANPFGTRLFEKSLKGDRELVDGMGLNGAIEELAIWQRQLKPTEIEALYNEGGGKSLQFWIDREDRDADRMPDTWETAFGLDPALDDAGTDKDGDGATNRQEYRQGSDPNDRHSRFQVVQVRRDDEGTYLQWKSTLGVRYTIKSSDSLYGRWLLEAWGIQAQGNETTYRLPKVGGNENQGHRFYR
ncbi:MAG: LamG-like jellyroll fold domain-containing protein, partial [Verrucomicrobiota bacterium]